MPQLGETVTEGTVGRWLKKSGDTVAKYEPLLEVETDKVASEIPSPFAGTLSKIMAEEGTTVPVGAPLCEILAAGETSAIAAPLSAAPASGSPASEAAPQPSPAPPAAAKPAITEPAAAESQSAGNGARYSPAVRRLARMHHIDLSGLAGSGRGGRLTARDVIAHVESAEVKQAPTQAAAGTAQAQPTVAPAQAPSAVPAQSPAAARTQPSAAAAPAQAAAPAATAAAPTPAAPPAQTAGTPIKVAAAQVQPLPVAPPGPEDTVVRLSQMRKTIAERMVLSKTTIPHAWSMVEVDVTNLVKWRTKEKDAFKAREGVALTYLPIVIQAVCAAIREYPTVNASWTGESIILRKHINVGVAVDIDEGLVVPVVRDADRYSLAGLAATINDLVSKARSRKLTLDDLSDGTITVDNTGSLGSIASVPIINPPQAAIVTMEAIVRRPWVVEDAIAIRHIMNVCLSLDHRILDGAVASHFLQAVKKRLETFSG